MTNNGKEAAVDVVVTDPIPECLEILDVTTTQGTVLVEGQVVTVQVGVIGPGYVVEIVIHTRVLADAPSPLEMENVALLKSPNGAERVSQPAQVSVPASLLAESGGRRPLWLALLGLGSAVGVALLFGVRRIATSRHAR